MINLKDANKGKTIVLTGGGTAGHITPNISLMPYLTDSFSNFYYIGSGAELEKKIINAYNAKSSVKINYIPITTVKLKRSFSPSNLLIPFKLFKGIRQSRKILSEIMPDAIFSKGGFVSVPVVISANRLGIPVVSHESDLSMGLANKLTKNCSSVICTTFECTAREVANGVHTGAPIKRELTLGDADLVYFKHKLNPANKTILVMGGSLGSVAINICLYEILPSLVKTYNVIHIVGAGNLNNSVCYPCYVQLEFVADIENYLYASNYIIARAGSNAIFEYLYLKKPMLLIPLGTKASRGDQLENAEFFEKNGWANVLQQEDLTPKRLLSEITRLTKDEERLVNNINNNKTASNGCLNIYKQIIGAIKKDGN